MNNPNRPGGPLDELANTDIGKIMKRTNDMMLNMSVERAALRSLVADLYEGLDEYWMAQPQYAKIVKVAELIHDQIKGSN